MRSLPRRSQVHAQPLEPGAWPRCHRVWPNGYFEERGLEARPGPARPQLRNRHRNRSWLPDNCQTVVGRSQPPGRRRSYRVAHVRLHDASRL